MSPHTNPKAPRDGEQLPLLLQTVPGPRGDATLLAIANEHEPFERPEPVPGREFRKLLALVYPVVRFQRQ